jgi:protein ImuB
MIACVWAPRIELQALLRAEPELRGQPVAIVGASGRVEQTTPEATVVGVTCGMKPAHAQSVCPFCEVRTPAREIVRAAESALIDLAHGFSPYVEPAAPGWVYFDASGLSRLFETRDELGRAMFAAAARVALEVRVGFGAGKFAARLRARHGDDVAWAELAAHALEPSPEAGTMLARWGVRTVADLARLNPDAMGRRLAKEGALLARRARAAVEDKLDDEPLCPVAAPTQFEEGIEFDDGIIDLESLAFVVRGVLDRLMARLACRALAATALEVKLALDPRGVHEIRVPLRAATRHVPTMATLVRLAVAARPPDRGVVGVKIAAVPSAPAIDQLSLFETVPPRPDELAATVARLAAIVGPDNVGSPQVVDSHKPGAQKLIEFDPPRSEPGAWSLEPGACVALRWIAPQEETNPLTQVAGARTIGHAGPWRVSAEWWQEPFDRDYYAVRTVDGAIHLVARAGESWQRVGVFD